MKTLLQRTKKIHKNLTDAGYALYDIDSDPRYTGQYIIIYSPSKDHYKIVRKDGDCGGYSYTHSGIWQYWTMDQVYDYIYN